MKNDFSVWHSPLKKLKRFIHAFNKSGRHLQFSINDVIHGKISTWPTWLLTMNPQFVHVVR